MVTACSPPASNGARAARQRDQIAGIKTHAANGDAGLLQLGRQRHHLSRRRLDIRCRSAAPDCPAAIERMPRRPALVIERLDEGMRHGAVDRNAEFLSSQHGCGAGKAGKVAKLARRHQARASAPWARRRAEIDQHLSLGAASFMRAALAAIRV